MTERTPEGLEATPLRMRYTNWRGDTAMRTIVPERVWFGATAWHPEPCWLLAAFDLDKGEHRSFALADCDFTADHVADAGNRATAPETEALVARLRGEPGTLVENLRAVANGMGSMKSPRGDYGLADDAADAIETLTRELDEALEAAEAATSDMHNGLWRFWAEKAREAAKNSVAAESARDEALARAERVEAENARLRGALDNIAAGYGMLGVNAEADLLWAMEEAERAALSAKEAGDE